MQYPRETLDAIKRAIPLDQFVAEQTDIKSCSGGYVCRCLFHSEKTPSMQIYSDGHFYCHACHAQGDLFTVAEHLYGGTFPEIVERLAARAGVLLESSGAEKPKRHGLSRKSHVDVMRESVDFYRRCLAAPEGATAREYLRGRKVSPEMITRFELGYASKEWEGLKTFLRGNNRLPWQGLEAKVLISKNQKIFDLFRHRVMFPIQDVAGCPIAFGARALDPEDMAKYINSPESQFFKKSGVLYGLHQARKAITQQRSALVTEGYLDVITLHQFGFENSVAALGTAFGRGHLTALESLCDELVLVFDGDRAGRTAAFKAATLTLQSGLKCRVLILPADEDADSLLHRAGRQAFELHLANAEDALKFCFQFVADLPPRDVIRWVKDFLSGLKDSRFRAFFVPKVAHGLNLSEHELRQWEEAQDIPSEASVEDVDIPAVEPAGNLLRDYPLLWGFVIRPEYLATFAGADIPFQTEAGRAFYASLCAHDGVNEAFLGKDGVAFVEYCHDREEAKDCRALYAWYRDMRMIVAGTVRE